MKIAIIGSGGREHALAWKLSQSPQAEKIFVLPGNGGTENNVNINPNDFPAIKDFCEKENVELLVVGPEDPLAGGIVDFFKDSAVKIFGPDKAGARLEGSKIWSKKFMKKYGVATADFWISDDADEIRQLAMEADGQLVVKFDGLAAGKGVFVCSTPLQVYGAVDTIRERYGQSARILFERKLTGQELSIIGFTDGKTMRLLQPSQDHKAAYDGDKGPNTGGMGAFCPVPFCDEALLARIDKDVIEPTLRGLQAEKIDYHGVIYFGLMITDEGPKLLEYNVRFGDPETDMILPALKNDLLQILLASTEGSLQQTELEFYNGYFVDVVLASGGYPGSYEKGKTISGLQDVSAETLVFHAGTRRKGKNLLTSGGRVLNVVAKGDNLPAAMEKVYKECAKIDFENICFRKDIGRKGLKK